MKDIRAYQLLAGFYIFQNITKQMVYEMEHRTPISLVLKSAIALGMKEDGTPATPVEWYSVSDDFAELAKERGEVVAYTPDAIAWGRQATGTPVHKDATAQKIIDLLNA